MLNSPIEEIKNRLDIAEVIGGYIKLSKAGANLRAPCPFHSEKKPSFFVSPARQMWHCFGGCNEGGDIFKFVMKIEGIEFGDALRLLAQKAGVELKKQSPEYAQLKSERARLYEICELACKFFEKQLEEGSTGREVKSYLLGRGIKEDSIKKWRIGYSPDVWQGLSDFLFSRGYQKDEIQKAGLALTSEKGSFYDRFRGRIIFPVFDLNSQVIGFGGRVFRVPAERVDDPAAPDGGQAKYVNSPATLLYDKSRILYGLDKAKMEIRKKNYCILVEGYVDVILASQAGSQNVVATSGTALTPYQLQILKRYSENLYTAFDMDPGGDSATKRGIDLAQNQGFNVRIITMPQDKDPADVISQNPQDWLSALGETKSILEFYFETAFSKFSSQTPEGKREISSALLPVIKRIQNKIEQSHWLQELAKKLMVKEEIVENEMKRILLNKDSPYLMETCSVVPVRTRQELLEERIAALLMKNPQSLNLIDDDCLAFMSANIQAILVDLRQQKSPQDANFVDYLYLKAEVEEDENIDCESEIRSCIKEIKNLDTKNKLDKISRDIKIAEGDSDLNKVSELMQKFKETSGRLINI